MTAGAAASVGVAAQPCRVEGQGVPCTHWIPSQDSTWLPGGKPGKSQASEEPGVEADWGMGQGETAISWRQDRLVLQVDSSPPWQGSSYAKPMCWRLPRGPYHDATQTTEDVKSLCGPSALPQILSYRACVGPADGVPRPSARTDSRPDGRQAPVALTRQPGFTRLFALEPGRPGAAVVGKTAHACVCLCSRRRPGAASPADVAAATSKQAPILERRRCAAGWGGAERAAGLPAATALDHLRCRSGAPHAVTNDRLSAKGAVGGKGVLAARPHPQNGFKLRLRASGLAVGVLRAGPGLLAEAL
eukprot:361335-Chlamydomonas_euryale.AAC.12